MTFNSPRASPLQAELLSKRPTFDAFHDRFGIMLRQAYGSTEAIMVSHNNSDDPDADWASVGRPAGDAQSSHRAGRRAMTWVNC